MTNANTNLSTYCFSKGSSVTLLFSFWVNSNNLVKSHDLVLLAALHQIENHVMVFHQIENHVMVHKQIPWTASNKSSLKNGGLHVEKLIGISNGNYNPCKQASKQPNTTIKILSVFLMPIIDRFKDSLRTEEPCY